MPSMAGDGWEEIVTQIMRAASCSRETAEFTARANGYAPPAPDPAAIAQAARDAAVLEKEEQREVVKRFRVCAFNVYSTSQARAAKVTPGIPDLWLVHRALPIALWWETKRQVGGVHSDAQRVFAADCDRCQVNYGTGDRYDAERWLVERGIAGVLAGAFEPTWNR